MKESTRNIARMHGWRVDRTVHNWVYFKFYGPYVKAMILTGNLTEKLIGRLRLSSRIFGMARARYHSKVMTLADVTKILTLEEAKGLPLDVDWIRDELL